MEVADKKTTYLWHLTVNAENLEFLSNMLLYSYFFSTDLAFRKGERGFFVPALKLLRQQISKIKTRARLFLFFIVS